MTALVVALILLIGGGGTALASDAARPGDFLFPLERSLEDIQLRIALSPESREKMVRELTEERLEELREIIDEEVSISPSGVTLESEATSTTASSTVNTLMIEADVFTDTTVVRIEINGKEFYFEISATTREGVASEITTRFPALTTEQIESRLDFEIEDRASRPKDRGIPTLSERGESRINVAVGEVLKFLDGAEVDDAQKRGLLTTLFSEVEGVTKVRRHGDSVRIQDDNSRLDIRIGDDGDSRVEIRDEKSRVRIEEKNGEVRVEKKEKKSDDEYQMLVASSTPGTFSFLEIEADIFTDTTVVKIESADDEFSFETTADTRSLIIDEIHSRLTALSLAQIDAALDIEVENRAKHPVERIRESNTDSDDSSVQGEEDGEDEARDDHERSSDDGDDEEDDSSEREGEGDN